MLFVAVCVTFSKVQRIFLSMNLRKVKKTATCCHLFTAKLFFMILLSNVTGRERKSCPNSIQLSKVGMKKREDLRSSVNNDLPEMWHLTPL